MRKWDGWELLMDVDNVVDDDKERERREREWDWRGRESDGET